jgi:hypothetical protein
MNLLQRTRRWIVAAVTCTVLAGIAAGPASASMLPPDWATKSSGYFTTADRYDQLQYRIELNAVDRAVVDFRLEGGSYWNRCLWRKTLIMPDGSGSEWPLTIDPSNAVYSATNGLWAGQVHNGQELRLYKAGFLGWDRYVGSIGDLNTIKPGTRVVFRWLHDSQSC